MASPTERARRERRGEHRSARCPTSRRGCSAAGSATACCATRSSSRWRSSGRGFAGVVLRAPRLTELIGAAGREGADLPARRWGRARTRRSTSTAATGRFSLLVHLHGDTPGADLGTGAARRRARCGSSGRKPSTALDGLDGPAALFGDETSFAVARTLARRSPGCVTAARCGCEVASRAEAYPVGRRPRHPARFARRQGARGDAPRAHRPAARLRRRRREPARSSSPAAPARSRRCASTCARPGPPEADRARLLGRRKARPRLTL